MRFEVGAQLGRYTIEALLGEGGMGEVYRAYDTLLHRRVALKILRSAARDNAADAGRALAKILREARVAAALHHPNAVSIFDLGEHDGLHFLAMELVSGRPLRELVGRPEVPLEQRVRWLTDIGRALDAAHQASIVHLDIKPENVLVRADAVVKVLDFGIARRFVFDRDPLAPPAKADTRSSTMAGTPRYMAPEQVQQLELDGRTDQFSWGVLAYELLAGKPPWGESSSLFDIFFAIVHETPPSVRDLNPEVPPALDAVVMRALAKPPEKRFPTMGELVEAIERVFPQLSPRPSWTSDHLPPTGAVEEQTKPDTGSGEQTGGGSAEDLAGITTRSAPHLSGAGALDTTLPDPTSLPRGDRSSDADPGGRARPSPSTSTLEVIHTSPSDPAPGSTPETKRAHGDGVGEASATAPRPGARPGRSRLVRLGAPLFAVLGLALGARALLTPGAEIPPRTASAPVPSASALAPPAPTIMTDLPPPAGCNEAALAGYRAGVQAQYDGNVNLARASFERAVNADPQCAGAHLRLTLVGYTSYSPPRLREIYQRALTLRAALSERDRLLLDALEPLVRRDPADLTAFTERMIALSERFPGDAEIVELSAEHAPDAETQIARGRAALAIDPRYADAWQRVGSAHKLQRRLEPAIAAIDACIRASPSAIDCIHEREDLARLQGRCDEAEENARLSVTRDPQSPAGYKGLAFALAAEGKPVQAIEEALRQRWSRLDEAERAVAEPFERAQLDALMGRFDRAEAEAREAEQRVADDPSYDAHAGPALLLVDIGIETNQIPVAADLAADFLGRRSAWASTLRPGSVGMKTLHLEPFLFDVERDARKLSEPAWRSARAAWTASTQRTGRLDEQMLWALDAAMPVRTAAEAAEAIRSMPPSIREAHGYVHPHVLAAPAFIGRALLLAGEVDEAIPFLRRAVTHCDALQIPFEETRASLWLGQALEKKGDAPGACAAYQLVERRWGSATPPSVTAATAMKRIDALRCVR